METRRSARIRGRAAPGPRSSSPVPPAAAAQELPPQAPELELDLPLAVEEESRLEAVSRLPAFVGALLRAHNRSLDAAARAVASLERALVKPLEPAWDELAEAAECGLLGGAPVRLGPDTSLSSLKLPALKKLASALGLHATGAKPDLVARLGPVVAAVPAGVHIGIASAVRPGFALALAASADVAALQEDDNPELEKRTSKSRAKETYCLADEDLDPFPHDLAMNPHYRSAPPMQLFTVRSAMEAGLLKYGGRAGLEAAQGAEKRGKRKAAELAQAERWAEGEPARTAAAEVRRAAREERLAAAAAKLEAAELQRLRGHPLIGRWAGSGQPEAELEALLQDLVAAEALLTGAPLPPGVEHPGPEVLAEARQGLAAFRASGRGRRLRHVLGQARQQVFWAAEVAGLQGEAVAVLEEARGDLERYRVMGPASMGSLSLILEAARSRLDMREREEEARAAIAGESPSFCVSVQPVLRLYIEQGGDLQALLAEARARLEREEEARAAIACKYPFYSGMVQPAMRLYIEQGGDLQAMLANARYPDSGGWAPVIEANKGDGPPRCPVCNKTTRSGAVCGIIDHLRSSHPTEFLSGLVTQQQ